MGKFFIPSTARTPADRVRESLDRAERCVINLRDTGPQVLELLHLLDQIAQGLAEFDSGVDVRAERARFETVQRQLRRRQRRFLTEAGASLREKRAAVQPDQSRWWWFLDEAVTRQRRRKMCRRLVGVLVVFAFLLVAWQVYDRFIAPPPQVRQAFRHSSDGEMLVEEWNLPAALAEFEMAAALTPDDPELWLWQGVIHFELGESGDAEAAFDTARALYETEFDFLLARGMTYLRVGDLAAASADAEQAIVESPNSGWGYYLRASISLGEGDRDAALADLERAEELAHAGGDTQLEAYARTQRAMVIQLQQY
ncbi:MAG: hypothetical protein SWK90_00830 [Chloroflexota bacterium]|nr:hypothetical protein [Chloroflexota bacterium]